MKVLVVDDDRALADIIAFTMKREGYQVIKAHNGKTALEQWREENPDLILLDVNLPIIDGFSVCQQIRQQSSTPIILLTVRGEEDDIVHGLELGADDYIPKPFSPRQLVARSQAVLRRAGMQQPLSKRRLDDMELIVDRRQVQIGQRDAISLTALESRLLEYLMLNAGHVLTTSSLIDYVWGPEGGDRDMLRQLVHRLRKKIEPDPSNPTYIENVPGVGYGLSKKSTSS
jgi:DNA-binding response OmpR family regulator